MPTLSRLQVKCHTCMREQVTVFTDAREPVYWECVECGSPHVSEIVTRPLNDKRYKSATWLKRQYEECTIREIATMCGVSDMTIFKWLKKHDIETRGRGKRA
jgi:hypothetical protein